MHLSRQIIYLFIFINIIDVKAFGQDVRILQMLNNVSETNIVSHIDELTYAGGHHSRVNFTQGNDSARSYIEKIFKSIFGVLTECDTLWVWAQSPFDQKPLFNVVAMLPGKQDAQEIVVIGAHYDSQAGRDSGWVNNWATMLAPGADDNASGVAAVLELTRIFAQNNSGYTNYYPIMFVAFAGEEGTTPGIPSYRNGSDHLARKLKSEGVQIRGMVNIDMIGYNAHYLYANIEADSQSFWLGEKCTQLNSLYNINLILNAPPFPAHSWSDQWSFWNQGYPAIFLIEHYDIGKPDTLYYQPNPNYHHLSDTLGTLNPHLMKSITQLALATVATLAKDTSFVEYKVPLAVYPNPFSQQVNVIVNLTSESIISLKVFDLLGREITTLIQTENRHRGIFQTSWNAVQCASGVYFVQLDANNQTFRTKMLLIR